MDVLQSAAGSPDFFAQAAGAAVDMVGLDSARVLLLEQEEWRPKAIHVRAGATPDANRRPSRHLLERHLRDKSPLREEPEAAPGSSLLGVRAVVAAPILNRRGEVVGALYGDRRDGRSPTRRITPLEGALVELLARGVAA